MNMAIAFSQPLSPRPFDTSDTSDTFDTLKLAQVLVQQHLISPSQREQALVLQQKTGKKIGRLLVEAGWITEDTLAQGLARQLKIPLINLKTYAFKADVVKLLPEAVARRCRALVVDDLDGALQVVVADPLDLVAFDELTRFLKRVVMLAVAPENQLAPAFDRLYRRTDEIIGLARALEKDLGEAVDFGALSATVGLDAAPVVRLLQSIFEDAVQAGASDVHIEPQKSGLQIRVRVGGLLQRQTRADKKMGAALAQRLKLMARLDISEKRRPQDGRFSVHLKEHTLDVRLSTLPTAFGESVVMRLLDHSGAKRQLDAMGVPAFMVATALQAVIAQRLIRLNCTECCADDNPSPQGLAWLARLMVPGDVVTPRRGVGCSACHHTGYWGRQGAYELMEMDAAMAQAASLADPSAFMKSAHERMQGQTLAHHALASALVRAGRTSVAEALRIGFDLEELV